jgi:hypothetical protein
MLNDHERQSYRDKGFLRVPNLLAEGDIAMLRSEWDRLWSEIDPAHPSIQWRGHEGRGRTADRIDGAYRLSPSLHALCTSAPLTDLAADLLGAPVVLFKEKLISKEPGTHGYGLHQDWPYWTDYEIPPDRMTTVLLALDRSDSQNGAVEVWPTARGVLPAPADDDPRDVDPAAVQASVGEVVPLEAGDAMLLHPLAPHRSAPNWSETPRRAYFVTYTTAEYASAAKRIEEDQGRMFVGNVLTSPQTAV